MVRFFWPTLYLLISTATDRPTSGVPAKSRVILGWVILDGA